MTTNYPICLLHLNIYFNSFIAGNNFICDNIPECVEEFAGFNYEFNDSGTPEFVSQNCSSCGKEYTEINVTPGNVAVLDNSTCYLKKDINVLKIIIEIKNNKNINYSSNVIPKYFS